MICRNGGIGRHEGLKIPWPVTVSYTHLDVYKRQPIQLILGLFAGVWCGASCFGHLDVVRYDTAPVSYTHLDVYKRQATYSGWIFLCELTLCHLIPTDTLFQVQF